MCSFRIAPCATCLCACLLLCVQARACASRCLFTLRLYACLRVCVSVCVFALRYATLRCDSIRFDLICWGLFLWLLIAIEIAAICIKLLQLPCHIPCPCPCPGHHPPLFKGSTVAACGEFNIHIHSYSCRYAINMPININDILSLTLSLSLIYVTQR